MAFRVIGIDPGISPAVAGLSNTGHDNFVKKLDRVGQFSFDAVRLRKIINRFNPSYVFVETMTPIAGQGISSTSALMAAWGIIQGVCVGCRVPCELIQPTAWKKALLNEKERGLSIKDQKKRKEHQKKAAVAKVQREYPDLTLVRPGCRVPDHNMAEAILIAKYGAELTDA